MVAAKPGSEVALLTNKERVIRVSIDAVPNLNKYSKGESICQLNRDERIISVVEVE
jgi:DNA gyrase subunit A